ncbi:KR domain-containing protein, partial [Streptomyces sp. NPDC006458]|uniref:KR domain-containing protein n=1 Tax=Streptomyces sp. NPDC006458 TaxID=3154302 RepID=UPI0033AFE762
DGIGIPAQVKSAEGTAIPDDFGPADRANGPAPDFALYCCPRPEESRPADVLAVLEAVRGTVRAWLADEHPSGGARTRLVIVTRGATTTGEHTLTQAPVWGLVRAAQAEHPDRLVLLDIDDTPASRQTLTAALASGESELALRGGEVLVPRLVKATGAAGPRPEPAGGTVLITGGTSGAGALVARHLVTAYGVRRLVLTGPPGVTGVEHDLTDLGAAVTVVPVDPADRDALAGLVDALEAEHPLTAVVHCAGPTDPALFDALTGEQLAAAVRATAEPAWHLHELTRDRNLAAFVLLSSSAGLMHGRGQAGLAAAGTFLDALAAHRTAQGLPGRSLALGPWEEATDEEERELLARVGLAAMTMSDGLALFDEALRAQAAASAPVRLERTVLRAGPQDLPPVLRALVRTPARAAGRRGAGADLRRRLTGLDAAERARAVLEAVRAHVAAVLGHLSPEAVEPDRAFQELGFDSLAAVELRRRLSEATGLDLPATLIFDYPTARGVAEHIDGAIDPSGGDPARPALTELDRLEAALVALDPAEGGHEAITTRLEALLRKWRDSQGRPVTDETGPDLDTATDDELFDVLDNELGIS